MQQTKIQSKPYTKSLFAFDLHASCRIRWLLVLILNELSWLVFLPRSDAEVGQRCDGLTMAHHPSTGWVNSLTPRWVGITINSNLVAKKVPLLAFLPPWSSGEDPNRYKLVELQSRARTLGPSDFNWPVLHVQHTGPEVY
jgi:hypothetical protein